MASHAGRIVARWFGLLALAQMLLADGCQQDAAETRRNARLALAAAVAILAVGAARLL